jgi:hypothetical protein
VTVYSSTTLRTTVWHVRQPSRGDAHTRRKIRSVVPCPSCWRAPCHQFVPTVCDLPVLVFQAVRGVRRPGPLGKNSVIFFVPSSPTRFLLLLCHVWKIDDAYWTNPCRLRSSSSSTIICEHICCGSNDMTTSTSIQR